MKSIILHQNNWENRKYHLIREEKNQFNGLENENSVEAIIEIEKLKSFENDNNLFRVSMTNYKQSNAEGMYKWVGMLHTLRKNLIISVDQNGMLDLVKNMNSVKEEWNKIKKIIDKEINDYSKYNDVLISGVENLVNDPIYFSRNLKFSYPYLYLFPPIFNKSLFSDKKEIGYRILYHLLNIREIPIITQEYLRKYDPINKQIEIEVEGKIDKNNFEQYKLTELIQMLKNRPRVPTIANLNYLERYQFDLNYQLSQGMCMSLLTVPGSLYREEKTILKQI